jgi:hypothetical protein
MIHSRPGFAPRTSDETPAKLNDDMIPALHRGHKMDANPSAANLQARADAAFVKLQAKRAQEEAQAIAEKLRLGPELLVNPAPTEPPKVLEPGR